MVLKVETFQSLSLIDKINLITKCGSRVEIELTDEEKVFLDMAEDCETWDDVVQVATAIYEWSKENEVRDDLDKAITNVHVDPEDEDEDEYEDDLSSSDWGDDDDEEESEEEETDGESTEDKLPELDDEEVAEETEETEKATGYKGGKGGSYDDEDGAKENL